MDVNLHNCDCMAFMAEKPEAYYDLAIVDPPYYPDARTIIVPGGDISTTGVKRRKYGMLQGKSMTEYSVPQNVKHLKEPRIHPTQKPVMLYKWLFHEFVKVGDKVLDTHGGSMSSAIAAYDFGDGVFDLCEIDPAYFAAGKERFENYTRQGKLF